MAYSSKKSSSSSCYGVRDNSKSHKPVKAEVKKAKYGFHGKKDLSKTRIYE